MVNKNKLKGTTIFTDHSRSYEERKRQEEIYVWVKNCWAKVKQLRIDFGKIGYKGTWTKWEEREVLKEKLEEEMNSQGENERDRESESEKAVVIENFQ